MRLVPTLLALTFATGIVDAVSYLGLGRVFTANMTGNVVLLGFALGGARGFSVAALLVSLGGFLVGAAAGGLLGERLAERRDRLVVAACWLEALLVAGATGLAAATADRYAVIAVLGVAMGLRNAAVRRMGIRDFSTTVLTSTLTLLAAESPLAGGSARLFLQRAASVAAMLAGAVAGAALVRHGLVAPLALAAGLAAALGAAYAARS